MPVHKRDNLAPPIRLYHLTAGLSFAHRNLRAQHSVLVSLGGQTRPLFTCPRCGLSPVLRPHRGALPFLPGRASRADQVRRLIQSCDLPLQALRQPVPRTKSRGASISRSAKDNGELGTWNAINPDTPSLNIDAIVETPATTPLPATLSLFAGGLSMLGLFGRRRKRKTAAAIEAG